MSFGASIGMNFINKGIDQFTFGVGQEYNRYAREKSRKWQVQDYQNAMTWRINDAKKHGIHPLAAIGASTSSGSPISVGGVSPPSGGGHPIYKKSTQTDERISLATARKAEAEADLAEKIAANHGQNPSDYYQGTGNMPGQPDGDVNVVTVPKQQTVKQSTGTEAGKAAYWQYVETADGGLKAMISKDISEPMESDWSASGEHAVRQGINALKDWSHLNDSQRNQVLMSQRPYSKKKGYEYRYNRWKRKWYLRRKTNGSKLYD